MKVAEDHNCTDEYCDDYKEIEAALVSGK